VTTVAPVYLASRVSGEAKSGTEVFCGRSRRTFPAAPLDRRGRSSFLLNISDYFKLDLEFDRTDNLLLFFFNPSTYHQKSHLPNGKTLKLNQHLRTLSGFYGDP